MTTPDPGPVPDEQLSMSQVRTGIGDVCNRVYHAGTHIALTWMGQPRVVVVPLAWWQQASKALRDAETGR